MKRFALLPALSALLLAAVLIGAVFAPQAPPGPTSRQAGDMIPDAITIAAFAAQSTARQQDPTLATSATSAQTAQLAPSHFDDSIEAPQVAAAMRAMAAIHVPSMEAIRLAQASAKAAAEEKSQQARLQDPTLATPAQSAQTAQLASSQYDSPGGLVTSAQATELGLPTLASAKAASQVAILAEAGSQMAILQNPELLALVQAEEASREGQTADGPVVLPTAANAEEEEESAESPAEVAFEEAEAAQAAGLSVSRVHSQGPVTAIQAWELTLPALTVNACSNSLSILCTANGMRPEQVASANTGR